VPKIDASGKEIGVSDINDLLWKTGANQPTWIFLLKAIEIYFKYGFCRGDKEAAKLKAYRLNEEQLK
jgi:hypothetical protein